jgi:hypothetical protein
MKHIKLSKRAIQVRNERINGMPNASSLKFMEWAKTAPSDELAAQRQYAHDWQRIAIDREIERRNKKD